MPPFQRKNLTVEARQHHDAKLIVNSNKMGMQTANPGDYLVTDPTAKEPKGSIYVVPRAEFERDHEPMAVLPRVKERNGLPDFVGHKEVSAVEIKAVDFKDDKMILTFVGEYKPRTFTGDERKDRPQPEPGWFMVVYDDGYTSFSPADKFRAGYSPR